MLLTPGPVELAPEINRAQTRKLIHHRTPEYREMHKRIVGMAREFFGSDEAYVITGSGTAGLEAGIASLANEKDSIFIPHNGKFGERLVEISKVFCPKVVAKKFEYGKGINLERVKAEIDAAKPTMVAFVYCETSTGVSNRAKEIAAYAKKSGALVFVDAVSAAGGHEFDAKGWGVDYVVTGSQKALGAPPGLALVGLNKEALAKIASNSPKAYYLDLRKFAKAQDKWETPDTPAVTLMYSLEEALDIAFREGIAKRIERHRKAGEMVRRRLGEMGFTMFAEKGYESNTVTAFKVASPEQEERIRKGLLKEEDILISGGQGEMKGKILRIGHMGNFRQEDLERCLNAIGRLK